MQACPVCSTTRSPEGMNRHLDICLIRGGGEVGGGGGGGGANLLQACPVCATLLPPEAINTHLDTCLTNTSTDTSINTSTSTNINTNINTSISTSTSTNINTKTSISTNSTNTSTNNTNINTNTNTRTNSNNTSTNVDNRTSIDTNTNTSSRTNTSASARLRKQKLKSPKKVPQFLNRVDPFTFFKQFATLSPSQNSKYTFPHPWAHPPMGPTNKATNSNIKGEHEKRPLENPTIKVERKKRRVAAPPPLPECPVCFEAMAPPVQIHQCGLGHLVCGGCRPRVEECPSRHGAVCEGASWADGGCRRSGGQGEGHVHSL